MMRSTQWNHPNDPPPGPCRPWPTHSEPPAPPPPALPAPAASPMPALLDEADGLALWYNDEQAPLPPPDTEHPGVHIEEVQEDELHDSGTEEF